MAQLFVFTAGNADAQRHLAESIASPVPAAMVFENFEPDKHQELREIAEAGFYAWGAVPGRQNETRWAAMAAGDYVLCVAENKYRFVAKVLSKYRNAKFARALWGSDSEGRTWECMYFLTKPVALTSPVRELGDELSQGYQGFTRISDDKVARLERTYGSIEGFVRERLHGSQGAIYLLLRSNAVSKWRDEEATSYHYGSTVPNHTKVVPGAACLLDRRVDGIVRIVGSGLIADVGEEPSTDPGVRHFRAAFSEYRSLTPPRMVTAEIRQELESMPGYNTQHSIRVLSKELYERLSRPAGAWMFQANPKFYDVRAAVRQLTEDSWLVTGYREEIGPGDRVYIWESGEAGGLVAVAEVLDRPSVRPETPDSLRFVKDASKFGGDQYRVGLAIRKPIEPILRRSQLKAIPALSKLSIFQFANATNFRVTPEEAVVFEELIAAQAGLVDLRSADVLRDLFQKFQGEKTPYPEWWRELAEFLEMMSTTDEAMRGTEGFQKRLWDENPVSSIGQGAISVAGAISDEMFRRWIGSMSFQPVPADPVEAGRYLQGLYVQMVDRLKPPRCTRIPHLKIFRVLTVLFPDHFTTIADKDKLRDLHDVMFAEPGSDVVARHIAIRRRLDEVLGPALGNVEALVFRMTFPWYLYEKAIALGKVSQKQDGEFTALLKSLRQRNLYFSQEVVSNYLLALQTNRFVILTGLSGTGKTQLRLAWRGTSNREFRRLVQ